METTQITQKPPQGALLSFDRVPPGWTFLLTPRLTQRTLRLDSLVCRQEYLLFQYPGCHLLWNQIYQKKITGHYSWAPAYMFFGIECVFWMPIKHKACDQTSKRDFLCLNIWMSRRFINSDRSAATVRCDAFDVSQMLRELPWTEGQRDTAQLPESRDHNRRRRARPPAWRTEKKSDRKSGGRHAG